MTTKTIPFLLLFASFFSFPFAYGDPPAFYRKSLEGWYWYQELPQEDQEEQEVPEEIALQTLAAYKQAFSRAVDIATAFPTKKNIKTVMELQRKSMVNADKFKNIWLQLTLEDPDLTQQLKNPSSEYGIQVKDSIKSKAIASALEKAKDTYFLVFAFRGEDPFSRAAARMVEAFSEKTGWTVVGVSLDGKTLPEFPEPHFSTDRGLKLGIDVAPAFLAVNPHANTSLRVGFGAISVQELKENIFFQLNTLEEAFHVR